MSFPETRAAGRTLFLQTASASLLLAALLLRPAQADDRPPVLPDAPPTTVAQSSISATIEIGLHAVGDALEARVPRRLVNVNDRTTECWHKRILGREINVDCVYSGYVERVGSIPLRAENGRLTAATPLLGVLSAQGVGPIVSRIHGSAQGQMTVYASARPQLRPDWSVSLDMTDGFRWTEPPVLTILGFRIDLSRYVTPQVESQLARLKGDFEARMRDLDIRAKAASAWRQAFVTMPLVDQPAVTLQTIPQSVAFSGLRIRGDMLEGSLEMKVTTETTIGAAPAFVTPTPLPDLGSDVSDPGRFSIIVPVGIGYDMIRQKLQDIVNARLQSGQGRAPDISIYPSAGKLVIGLNIPNDTTSLYLSATPQIDASTQTLQLADISVGTDNPPPDGSALASLANDPGLLPAIHQQMSLSVQDKLQGIMTSVNALLNRPLADGFRSEGQLTTAGVSRVSLLADHIRVDFRAAGDLRLVYGL